MPARPTSSDRTFPECLSRFRCLPKGEIAGVVFFVFVYIHPRAVFHAGEIFLRKLAIAGKLGDAEVIGAIVSAIGEALLLELRNKACHLFDVLSGADKNGRLDIQCRAVVEKGLLVFGGVILDAQPFLGGFADYLVVHVSDVHDVAHCETALPKETAEDVDCDKSPEVADVAVVVHGGAASVHPHFIVLQRMEFFYLAGQRVVQAQGHRLKTSATGSSILGGQSKQGQIEPPGTLEASLERWLDPRRR